MFEANSVIIKNIRFRFREPQQFIFIFGFPIMFIALFWLMFGQTKFMTDYTMFDVFTFGLLGFITSFAVHSSSIAFSLEKESGTLKRLKTTPVGGSNSIFIGFIMSEGLVVILQLLLTYFIVFGLLHVHFSNIYGLILSFLMFLIYAFTCIGIGLIFASLLNAKLAGQLPLIIVMPFIFLSGSIIPLNSSITYLNPLFWVYQFSIQVAFFGTTDLTQNIKFVNFMSNSVVETSFPLLICIPIAVLTSVLFMILGIIIYHKKTQ